MPSLPHPLVAEELPTPVLPCPADPLLFFFTIPGSCSVLYRFDDRLMDVITFPGAGLGVRNTYGVGADSVFFDREGRIYRYYWKQERLCVYLDASGAGCFAANPAWDGKNLFFLATNDPTLGALGYGDLAVILDADGPCPVVLSLEEINRVTRSHGSLVSYAVSRAGEIIVFSTRDGWLFCAPWSGERAGPAWDTGIRNAGDVEIEAQGRLIAWADKKMKRIAFSSGCFEDICFLPSPLGCITAVSGLGFRGKTPRYLTYRVTLPDARTHLVAYDFCSELTRSLAVLNTSK